MCAARGRINECTAYCSIACAIHPTVRPNANSTKADPRGRFSARRSTTRPKSIVGNSPSSTRHCVPARAHVPVAGASGHPFSSWSNSSRARGRHRGRAGARIRGPIRPGEGGRPSRDARGRATQLHRGMFRCAPCSHRGGDPEVPRARPRPRRREASGRRHHASGERRDVELVIGAENQCHFEEPAFPPLTEVPSARELCGYRRRHISRLERHGRRQQVQDPPAGCADCFRSQVERGRVVHRRERQDRLQPLHDGKWPDVRDGCSARGRARCFRDLSSGVLVPEQPRPLRSGCSLPAVTTSRPR